MTPEKVARAKAAWKGLSAFVAGKEILDARTDASRLRSTLKATTDVRNALMELGLSKLPENDPGRIWADKTDKALRIYSALLSFLVEQSSNTQRPYSWRDRAEPWANLSSDIAAICMPEFGVGMAITSIGAKKARNLIINSATDELEAAMAKDWNAEGYLDSKLQQIRENEAAVGETIDRYESVHPTKTAGSNLAKR